MIDLALIAEHLAPSGLILRESFNFRPGDNAPAGPSGAPARSVLLIGNAGAGYWQHFEAWRTTQPSDVANPLDTWCREIIGDVAGRFGARAVSPSDKPFLPFQNWAMRAEALRPSPLGILIHPRFGLWHAYRGALLLDAETPAAAVHASIHLCDGCASKPCLNACPVDAYSAEAFAYQACLEHVRGPTGGDCRDGGCRNRNACPYGLEYRYPPRVQAFHMAAYARAGQ